MNSIQLPAIPLPEGCEEQTVKLLQGIKGMFQFSSDPTAVTNPAIRSVSASIEHALDSGVKQALACAAKRKG